MANQHINPARFPLTPSQKLILTGQLLQPNEPLYNMVLTFRINGPLNVQLFNQAFNTLIKHCDAMRIVIDDVASLTPSQVVLEYQEHALEFVDLSQHAEPEMAYSTWLQQRKTFNFTLTQCLFDSALVKLNDTQFIWYFNQHHLVTDASSTSVIYKYVSHCYQLALDNQLSQAPDLPSFGEYAQKQADKTQSKIFLGAQHYWRKQAKADPLPIEFYRTLPQKKTAVTLRYPCPLGLERSNKLRALSQRAHFASFSADMGLMQLLSTVLFSYLSRISKQQHLTIGTPFHSRRNNTEKQLAGLLINLFPLNVQLTNQDSFQSLYDKVAEANKALLVNALPGANQTHNFDVVLNYIPSVLGDFAGMPMHSDWVHPDSGDRNHLMRLQVQNFDQNEAITLFFDLNADAFQGRDSKLVIEHFLILLDAFLVNPAQLVNAPPLVRSIELQSVNRSTEVADTANTELGLSTVDMLQTTAMEHNAKTALVCGEHNVSYAQLNNQSNAIANYLIANNLVSAAPIAVYMDRSLLSVATILGIIKAGAAFLPIDISYPLSRVDYIVRDAQVKLVLTVSEYTEKFNNMNQRVLLIDNHWYEIINAELSGELPKISLQQTAYIIYTSGSTGEPKGVEVTHQGLANYISWARRYYLQGKVLDFPLFSSLSFDLTLTSVFLPLISGGKLVIYPEPLSKNEILIRAVIEDNRVDIIKLTPAHLALIQSMDFCTSKLKKLIVGGDDFKTDLALVMDTNFAGNIEIYNEYGPTEATVACIAHKFNPLRDRGASVPIGTPINNAKIYLLDEYLHAVPQGVVGEIYIAGLGLAKGYLNKAELTEERFIRHPETGIRLYKTGDLATFNEHGVMTYLGRNDHQVKIRGVRIETAEIEAELLNVANVKEVIVDISARFGIEGVVNDTELTVEKCVRCGLAANHPSAQLDDEKVCRLCRTYEKQEAMAQAYYQDLPTLQAWIDKIKARSKGKQDSIMLLSGGKDSSYTLCKLVDMGLTPLVFTLDNGYISDGAKANMQRLVDKLGLEFIIGKTDAMDDIFVDSLTRFSNVCNGCFKTIYTMSMKLAKERGISVICTGLSRGQIFETRVAHLFQQGCFSPDTIDARIIEARKAYHRADDIISRRLDVTVFQDDDIFEQIQYLDYFRYADVTLDEIYDYLNNIAPWIRPSDTGRSTNCLINDAGIYVHKKERGYHNYALPYSWDVRLGHKEREAALDELDDELDQEKVDDILNRVGYKPQAAKMHTGRDDTLVAYYSGPAEIQKNILQKHLAASLPKEYIPTQFIWLPKLPLTSNGKVDRKALPKPIHSTRDLTVNYIAPSSETETTLARLWEQLLGVKDVGIADNFFDLGGDSIVNIQIVAAARESGIDITPQQIFDYPTIGELANVVGTVNVFTAAQGRVTGTLPLLPVQSRYFATKPFNVNQFVQSVTLNVTADFTTPLLQQAFKHLLQHHDGLRSCFRQQASGNWQQEILVRAEAVVKEYKLLATENREQVIRKQRQMLMNHLDIESGVLVAACHLIENEQSYLIMVIHHLVVDGVSWWVLLDDLATSCKQLAQQQPVSLAAKSCSVKQWAETVNEYANTPSALNTLDFWRQQALQLTATKTLCLSNVVNTLSVTLDKHQTRQLLFDVPSAFGVQVPDVLLAALVACHPWFAEQAIAFEENALLVDIEGHGREEVIKGIDSMRTVAWFTSIYPLLLCGDMPSLGDLLKATKERIRKVPNRGIDYGLLRYMSADARITKQLAGLPQAPILFNYMGKWERTLSDNSPFRFVTPITAHCGVQAKNTYALQINAMIFDDELQLAFTYDSELFDTNALRAFSTQYQQQISSLIEYCLNNQNLSYTPSDFGNADISQDDLEDIFAEFGED